MSDDIAVSIDNVSFRYTESDHWTLKDVSLQIRTGDFVGVIGPNGGGKSTLIKLILGQLQPNTGNVAVFGTKSTGHSPQIGYVPQHTQFSRSFPIRVIDVVAMGALRGLKLGFRIDGKVRSECVRTLEYFRVDHLWNHKIAELSGGQLQRVLIARALVSNPKILLLDEPTASIDPGGELEVFQLLTRLFKDLTIVVVSHDVGFVSGFINKIACVNQTLVTHIPAEISTELLEKLYHGHIHAVLHGSHEHASCEHGHPVSSGFHQTSSPES